MLSKDQLIQNIQQINRSATREWLSLFDVKALQRYLDHLQKTLEPRGSKSFWVRPGDSNVVVTRQAS